MAPTNNAIERRGNQALVDAPAASTPVSGLITAVDALSKQLKEATARYHVISPVVSTSSLAPGYGAALSVVNVDLADGSSDVYKDNLMKGFERALTKISLMRLSAALGISWTGTRRLDNGQRRFYWNVEVHGEYRAPDGTLQKINASREVDFTDGSAQIAGKSTAEVAQMRKHGQQLAETKAKLRAVRDFGVKPKYTLDELAKPFLVCRFSFMPDMQNPEVAKLVTAAALGVTHLLYAPAPAAPDSDDTDLPPELGGGRASNAPQLGAGSSATAAAPTAASTSVPSKPAEPRELGDEDLEADTRPRYRVERVLDKNDAGDFQIFLAGGSTVLTADGEVAKAAARAKKAGHAVSFEAAKGRIDEIAVLDEPAPTAAAAGGQGGDGGGGNDEGADDGLRTVEKIEPRSGTSPDKKNPGQSKPWTLYTIIVNTGEAYKTFSKSIADLAQEARDKGWKVRISAETNERYPDQLDITDLVLIDPRQGSLPMDGGKY